MSLWCFYVAAQYFEEILFDLKKHNQKKKQTESVHNVVMCYVVECEYPAGVNVNVCGAAETPEEQAGK